MFGRICSLYVLSILWTLLSAQQNARNLCQLSRQNMARLTRAFSIGNFLYVGDGEVFYPMLDDYQYSFEVRIHILFNDFDLTSLWSVVHFRDISCQSETCNKAKDLVIALGDKGSTSAYRSFRFGYDSDGRSFLSPISDESDMPWDLPANGTSTDFEKVILANQSVGKFVGAFFHKNADTLYFLRDVSNDRSKSELAFKELGTDGNFKNSPEIQKTNPFDRVDMVLDLPKDQVYAITQTQNGPVVRKLNVMSGRARLDEEKTPLKEFFNCYGNSTLITRVPVGETTTTDVNGGSGSDGGSGDFETTLGDSGETPGPDDTVSPIDSDSKTTIDTGNDTTTTTMKSSNTPKKTFKNTTTPPTKPPSLSKKKNWLIWVIIGIILALIILAIIFFFICSGSKSNEEQATPKSDAQVTSGAQVSAQTPEAPPGTGPEQPPPAGATGAPSQEPSSETSDTLRPVGSGEVPVDSVRSSEV